LLAALGRVLNEEFGWQDDPVAAALAQLLRIGEVVGPVERLSVVADDPTMTGCSRLPLRP
jgi:hypothetical protein